MVNKKGKHRLPPHALHPSAERVRANSIIGKILFPGILHRHTEVPAFGSQQKHIIMRHMHIIIPAANIAVSPFLLKNIQTLYSKSPALSRGILLYRQSLFILPVPGICGAGAFEHFVMNP